MAAIRPAHPVTSTPFVRKNAAAKDVKKQQPVKVQVHDGFVMHTVSIAPSNGLQGTLEKISTALNSPNHLVQMSYETPWSQKIGTKKSVSYISNDDEMEDFWTMYLRYVNNKRKGKANVDEEVVGIVFRNMLDGPSVSCSLTRLFTTVTDFVLFRRRERPELAAKKTRQQSRQKTPQCSMREAQPRRRSTSRHSRSRSTSSARATTAFATRPGRTYV